MTEAPTHLVLAAALGLIAVSPGVLAAPDAGTSSLEVVVQVLQSSTQAGPGPEKSSLKWMKQQFSNQGLGFKALRRITEHHLVLQQGKPVELQLPNGRAEVIQFQAFSRSGAEVRIGPRNRDVNYTITDENPIFLDAGPFEHGRILLIVSSATDYRTHEQLTDSPDAGQ